MRKCKPVREDPGEERQGVLWIRVQRLGVIRLVSDHIGRLERPLNRLQGTPSKSSVDCRHAAPDFLLEQAQAAHVDKESRHDVEGQFLRRSDIRLRGADGCKEPRLCNLHTKPAVWYMHARNIALPLAREKLYALVLTRAFLTYSLHCIAVALVRETTRILHEQLPGSQVSVCAAWSPDGIDGRHYDYSALAEASDYLYVMAYDVRSQVRGLPSHVLHCCSCPYISHLCLHHPRRFLRRDARHPQTALSRPQSRGSQDTWLSGYHRRRLFSALPGTVMCMSASRVASRQVKRA